jgi:uncharacterized membrane protein YfcA
VILGLTPVELTAISLSLALGGFLKGVTGIGMPVIVIPVMALFIGIESSIIVMAIPGVISNGWMTWHNRECYKEVTGMTVILVAGVIGTVVGVAILYVASERLLSIVLFAWIVVYIASRILHPDFRLALQTQRLIAPWVGVTAGIFQGATGICAPVLATYFHAIRLRPNAYVLAVSAPFALLSLAQAISFSAAGMFTEELLVLGVLALAPAIVSIPLGIYVRPMINRDLFDKLILVLIAVMGARLALYAW